MANLPPKDRITGNALHTIKVILGGRFGFFVFQLGNFKGEWGVRGAGEGGSVFIENPRRGGFPGGGWAEGPGGCLRRIGEFFVG